MGDISKFSGVWLSNLTFHDDERNGDFQSRHYLQAMQTGDEVVLQTIESLNDSYMLIRLHVENELAIGSWEEQTAAEGFYGGAIYSGACQFVISTDGAHLQGRWIGFTKAKEVRSHVWELQYVGASVPANTQPLHADRP